MKAPLHALAAAVTVALAGCGLFADGPGLALTAEAAGADAVWLHVAAEPGTRVSLSRGGAEIDAFTLSGADTTVGDEGLAPATAYTWTASAEGAEAKAEGATLGRSSHAVTWEVYELGSFSGLLRDVAVIAEDDVWVVGELTERLPSGEPEVEIYNAAHWDGTAWTLVRVPFYTFCNQTHTGPYAATAVFSAGPGALWMSSSSQVSRLSGGVQESLVCTPASPLALWGPDSSTLYAVGGVGTIAHFDGTSWSRVESGVATRLTDVFGAGDHAFAAGPQTPEAPTALLRLTPDGRAEPVPVEPFGGRDGRILGLVESVWTDGSTLLTLASGVYRSPVTTGGEGRRLPGSPGGSRLRGTASNDVFVVSRSGAVSHFDGVEWHRYAEVTDESNRYVSVAVTGRVVVAVGYRYASGTDYHGVVAIGRR